MTIRNQVAKLELLAVRRSGRRSVVAISIGRPYEIHDGRGANRAACSISVRGLGPHRYNPRRILGGDTFQALSITLAFVRLRLRDFVRAGNRLLFADGKHRFPIEAYFPRYGSELNSGASPDRGRRTQRGGWRGARGDPGRRAPISRLCRDGLARSADGPWRGNLPVSRYDLREGSAPRPGTRT